ncbi:KpsF/GutQ family sugar-phosphate isomerase [Ephemeroptericola cinctiostellae]|nr:KpsF/GutQ family sugar-phosphate isomerase [Ephemeroptericola cinctiostellae]
MITNNSTHLNDDAILNVALNVLTIEAQALMDLTRTLDINFVNAVRTMLACKGRVVVSGMGKSGHIARKLAATFASTGTPAFFMHPGEAAHGDLGMITADDVVLALSYSGKSDELMAILPAVKRHNTKLIAMTGNPESPMAKLSDVHLLVKVEKEACPLNLAPTASTTASLALGDALAVALLELRGFSADDFARSHPAGALGRRLLTYVANVMRLGDDIPAVSSGASLTDALLMMSQKRMGMTAVVDEAHKVLGVLTDGDVRRLFEKGVDVRTLRIDDVMHPNPHTIASDVLAVSAVEMMQTHRINQLLVVDQDHALVGALNVHDLFAAGVM